MPDKIITLSIADDDLFDDENPRPTPSVLMAESATERAYLSHSSADWSGVTHEVVGEWAETTGAPLTLIGLAYADWIRPFGNDAGKATGNLDSMRWQGHPEAKWYDYDDADPEDIQTRRYPITNMPFTLQIERTYIDDDGFPQIPHGWKVTMLSEDPQRDITARAIGIYDDNDNYLYTTGAFIDDGSGNYFTECPVGQRTADEVQINFKLLLGSAPEGAWVLPIGAANDDAQFWSADQ